MSAEIAYQGNDISITIDLTNKITGEAINIDDLAELFIYIMLRGNSTPINKFSKAGATGYTALLKVDSKHYRADWKSADTKVAIPNMYYLEINVVETDEDFDEDEKNSIGTVDVIDLRKSVIKAESS